MLRLHPACPPDAEVGGQLAAVGFLMNIDWGATWGRGAIAGNATKRTDTINAAGYNSFWVEWTSSVTAVSLTLEPIDPSSGAALPVTLLFTPGAAGSNNLTFGAFGSVPALTGFVFNLFNLVLINLAAGATNVTSLRLMACAR